MEYLSSRYFSKSNWRHFARGLISELMAYVSLPTLPEPAIILHDYLTQNANMRSVVTREIERVSLIQMVNGWDEMTRVRTAERYTVPLHGVTSQFYRSLWQTFRLTWSHTFYFNSIHIQHFWAL